MMAIVVLVVAEADLDIIKPGCMHPGFFAVCFVSCLYLQFEYPVLFPGRQYVPYEGFAGFSFLEGEQVMVFF